MSRHRLPATACRQTMLVWRPQAAVAAFILLFVAPAAAQDAGGVRSRTVAFDTVIGVQDSFMDGGESRTVVIVAFGYTRISGEWTHDRFGTSTGVRNADGWTMQVRHTVTPRVFVHSRITAIRAPAAPPSVTEVFIPNRFRAADSTLGYLLSPDLTVRVGHSAVRSWTAGAFDHRLGLSLMWARRWW